MRRFLSAFAVMMVCAVTAWAQGIDHYQCAIVDNADAIIGIEVDSFTKAPAVAQIKQMLAPFLKEDPKAANDDLKEIRQVCSIMGIDLANWDKLILHAMVTVAFNGASPDDPDLSKLDVVVAALLAGPINFDKFPEALKTVLSAEDLKETTIAKKQYKNAVAFEIHDKAPDTPAAVNKVTVALVKQNALFIGTTKSVEKALNRVDNQQAPKNMDKFLFGQNGQIQIAMRMFPEMKASLTTMADDIPGGADLANSKGFALLLNATDKFNLALNLQTAKPEDAAAFKKQVWDTQFAPTIGAISQMAKAQTNSQLTALDSIKCSVNGSVLGISASFTLNDIIQGVAAAQKIQAAQAQAAQAQAAQTTTDVKQAADNQADDADDKGDDDDDDDDDDDEEE